MPELMKDRMKRDKDEFTRGRAIGYEDGFQAGKEVERTFNRRKNLRAGVIGFFIGAGAFAFIAFIHAAGKL